MPSLLLPSHHRNGKRRTARRKRIQISLLSAVLNYFIMTRKMILLYQVLKIMSKKPHAVTWYEEGDS